VTAKKAAAAPPKEEHVSFQPDKWLMEDLEAFEEVTGIAFDEAISPAPLLDHRGQPLRDERGRPINGLKMSAKTMTAIVWIEKRHVDPSFTIEQARKVRATALVLEGGKAPARRPRKQPADRKPSKRAASQRSASSTGTPRNKSAR
jgi:hypothetical protein